MSLTFEIVTEGLKEIAGKAPVTVGSDHGVYEYVFYSCEPGAEVLAAMHMANIAGTRGKKFSSGRLIVNNSELSPAVKSAMDKYKANICVTFGPHMDDPSNNLMAINILTPNKVYDTYLFDTEPV
jgi:hypothetical protein